jgi:hypothetical protein
LAFKQLISRLVRDFGKANYRPLCSIQLVVACEIRYFFRSLDRPSLARPLSDFFAIGALAIGSLVIRRGRIDDFAIRNLEIDRLTVESSSTEVI